MNSKQKHKINPAYCKAFGTHLRKLIDSNGYGVREFANIADIEYGTLSRIVRGVTNPTISTVLHLAESLGVSHNELFNFKFLTNKKEK